MKRRPTDRLVMINILILFMTAFSYSYHCGLDSTEKIAVNTFGKTKACLTALADAPSTPGYPRMYFQKLGSKEDFAFRCHTENKTHMRILFLEDDGLQSLKLPIYYYMSGIDHTDLPRNILHFKHQNNDYYIQFEYSDVVNVMTAEKLPAVTKEMMVSMSKVQNEYIKKYETWLKTQNKSDSIVLSSPTDDELPALLNCLEAKQQDVVNTYLQNKFKGKIPAYGTIIQNLKALKDLTQEQKAKYQRPWSEFETEFMRDIVKTHPVCDGIVTETSSRKALDSNFGRNKELYNRMRSYLTLD